MHNIDDKHSTRPGMGSGTSEFRATQDRMRAAYVASVLTLPPAARDADPMLGQRWAAVDFVGPALGQHWVNISCFRA